MFAVAVLATATAASGQQLQKITIGVSSSSLPAASARIAKQMGLFEKQGLDANVTALQTGITATMGLISGSLDFVTTGPSDVVLSQARGQDVVALNGLLHGFSAVLVLSKAAVEKVGVSPNAPVSARLKALDGLRIATTSATSTFGVAPKASAESVGANIKFVYMAQPAMVAALQTGAIQGFVASAPYYLQPVQNGFGVVWISGPKGEFPVAPINSVVLITKRDFAKANPDVIKRTNAAFNDLGKAVEERPAEVKAAIAKLFPEIDAKTLDLILDVELKGFRTTPLTPEVMAHEIAFMKAGGQMPETASLKPAALLFP